MPYDLKYQEDCLRFTFVSSGVNGNLNKIITFMPLAEHDDVYNLGLTEEVDIILGTTSDTVTSLNGDTWKIMTTLWDAFKLFSKKYPDFAVIISSNHVDDTAEHAFWRMKLYQKFIARKYSKIQKRYELLGVPRDVFNETKRFTKWEPVDLTKEYAAFLLTPR